jgi:hypothetical protein
MLGGEMHTRRKSRLLGSIILFVFVIACGISFDGCSQKNVDEALQFELTRQSLVLTQQALSKENAQPPVDSGSSDTSSNGDDSQPQAPADEEDEDETPCNSSKMVSETISDGTVFQPGDTFEKSWTLRNQGDCDWNTSYAFRFIEGNQMSGESSIKVSSVIEPNETVTFIVHLTAPSAAGDYTGVWRLFSDDGEELGKYWVKITVGTPGPPPSAFAVTSVIFDPSHPSVDMGCPGGYVARAEIFVSAAGKVTYTWTDTAGGSSTKSITFSGAGSKIVEYTTANITVTGDYSASLYIDEPNHQSFGAKSFHINCT